MANNFAVTQRVTWTTLAILSNELKILPNLFNGYDKEFGQAGEKIGQTLYVRKPQRFVGRSGAVFTPEGLNNLTTPVVINQQTGVDFQVNTFEKMLNMEALTDQYLRPAAKRIANILDFACAQFIAQNTWNLVGTYGTTPNGTTAFQTYLKANQKMDENLADAENRCMVINADAATQVVDSLKGVFNPQATLTKQYQTSRMGRDTGGMDWYQSQNLAPLTAGSWAGSPTVATSGSLQTAAGGNNATMALNVAGFSTGTVAVGDVFTIANVYMTNAANYQATNTLQQFVVLEAASITSTGTLQIAPAITPSGQYQNVSVAPALSAVITPVSTVSTQGTQYLCFQKDAYTFVSLPGDVPGGTDMAYQETDPETGVSLRFVRDYNSVYDLWVCRFDVYWGIAPLYREFAVRVAGA